jgi:hypothetical protein
MKKEIKHKENNLKIETRLLEIKSLFRYLFNFWRTKKIMDSINEKNLSEIKNKKQKTATVLLHGNFQNYHSLMIDVIKWFNKKDLTIISLGYDYREDIEKSAEKIKTDIDKILEKTKADKVNIIALSYGGILARYYAEKLNKYKKINKLVTISTPYFPVKRFSIGYFLNFLVGGHGCKDNIILKELINKNSIKNHLAISARNDKIIGYKKINFPNIKTITLDGGHHPLAHNIERLNIALDYIQENKNKNHNR